MNPRFNNKICIVTGAAQGIGQGVALALAAEGGTVVLADRSEFVQHTAEAIRSAGGAKFRNAGQVCISPTVVFSAWPKARAWARLPTRAA